MKLLEKIKKIKQENKRAFMLSIAAIFMFLFLVIGATYAYFAGFIGGGQSASIQANTGTTDSLTFIAGDPIRIHATMENFTEGMKDLKGTTTATAKLMANNTTKEASGRYNVFFVIEDNDFSYSTSDGRTELLLKVTDPNGNEIENITGLKRVENGFDITTRTGGYLIAADYDISASGNEATEQTWNVEVTLVNLDADQNGNKGKKLNGYIYITADQISVYEAANIDTINTSTTYNSVDANLSITPGTSEIDKYYYAIEEKTEKVAMAGTIVKQMSNAVAITDEDYEESDAPEFTFENLKEKTTYIIYSYVIDKQGVKSNVYHTEITTEEYKTATIEDVTFTSTLNSITATVSATEGNNSIAKYEYSKDDGVTWEESTSNIFTFDNLLDTTEYKIVVRAIDSEGRVSAEWRKSVSTETYVNPNITTVVTTSKTWNSISFQITAAKGTNDVSKYYYSTDNGDTWSEGGTSSSYTISSLTENTEYNILVKVEDTEGRYSNIYTSYSETTNEYVLPKVTATISEITSSSFKINATATLGDGTIKRYQFSKDNGSNWVTVNSTATTYSHMFDTLTGSTTYQVSIRVIDSNNKRSSIYKTTVTTLAANICTTGTNLATCIKNQYTGTQGENGLYYHTSSLANSAGDNSYRYAGSNPNNYVCFGLNSSSTCYTSDMYRIIGVFGNQVKLIKYDYASTYFFGDSYTSLYSNNARDWPYYSRYKGDMERVDMALPSWLSGSDTFNWGSNHLSTLLNQKFITKYATAWQNKVATTTWQVGGMSEDNGLSTVKTAYNYELGANKTTSTYSAKVGLMYVSDYGYAVPSEHWNVNLSNYDTVEPYNWMNMGMADWTITKVINGSENKIFGIHYAGTGSVNTSTATSMTYSLARPVFYLTSSVTYKSGLGSKSSPIILN